MLVDKNDLLHVINWLAQQRKRRENIIHVDLDVTSMKYQ